MNTDFPQAVMANWTEAHRKQQHAAEVVDGLPALDAQISRLQQSLDQLKAEHAAKGRQHMELLEAAEQYREMVELWCSAHGRELPPPPKVAIPEPGAQEARLLPSPAERIAAFVEGDVAPELPGEPVTSAAADLTMPDPAGGEAPAQGAFHPGGRNGAVGRPGDRNA